MYPYSMSDILCKCMLHILYKLPGMTPLHRVVQSRQADRHVLELLLEKDVNPMVRDHEGRTCLTIAEENKDSAQNI